MFFPRVSNKYLFNKTVLLIILFFWSICLSPSFPFRSLKNENKNNYNKILVNEENETKASLNPFPKENESNNVSGHLGEHTDFVSLGKLLTSAMKLVITILTLVFVFD